MVLFGINVIWICFLCLLFTFIIQRFIRRCQFVTLIDKIPGPKGFPLLGILWDIQTSRKNLTSLENTFLKPFVKTKSVVRLWCGPLPTIFLVKAEAAKVLLSDNRQIDKAYGYRFITETFGDGLVASTGPLWQRHRKLINPSFGFRMMDSFLQVINEDTDILVNLLEKHCQENGSQQVNIYTYVSKCLLDIICESAMGYKLDSQLKDDPEFAVALKTLLKIIVWRGARPQYYPNYIYNLTDTKKKEIEALQIINNLTKEIIAKKQKEIAEKKRQNRENMTQLDDLGQKPKLSFIDTLLENFVTDDNKNVQGLTEEEIVAEVNNLLVAGHETTASSSAWFFYCVAHHPDIQKKIQDEIDQVFTDGDEVTNEHLAQMNYLELVVKESLRLFPAIPNFGRTLSTDINICGYKIPAGVNVFVSLYWIHRDEDQYKDPHIFDPDRFLPENSTDRNQYAYIPFSSGLRNCLGQKLGLMEMKTVAMKVLKKFNVEIDGKFQSEPDVVFEPTIRGVNPIMIKFIPRKCDY